MKKLFFVFLLIFFSGPVVAATLQGVGEIERCWYKDSSWSSWTVNCGGTVVSGDGVCAQESAEFGEGAEVVTVATVATEELHCWCHMTKPYTGIYVYVKDVSYAGINCTVECNIKCRNLWIGEFCAKGGYDEDCIADYGDGLFSNKEEQELFLSMLFATELPKHLCEIGISKIVTSMGDSFALWTEKYTTPALVVQYNDQKCYGKMESGHGRLNFKIGDKVYHLVE